MAIIHITMPPSTHVTLHAFARCVEVGNQIEVAFNLAGTITVDQPELFTPPFVPGSYAAGTTIGPYAVNTVGTANFTFVFHKNGNSETDTLKLEIKTNCP